LNIKLKRKKEIELLEGPIKEKQLIEKESKKI
jgi:hypothetical protein